MIDEYLVKIVSIGEAIEIIIPAKAQVVELRQVIMQTGDDIEAGEIKFSELVVEEELLHDPDLAVEGLCNARLIHQSHAGRHEHVVLLASANKSGIRGPEKGRVNGNRKRFIFFHPL